MATDFSKPDSTYRLLYPNETEAERYKRWLKVRDAQLDREVRSRCSYRGHFIRVRAENKVLKRRIKELEL